MREDGTEDSPYVFEVEYEYVVAKRPYRSGAVSHGYSGSDDYSDAQRLAQQYQPGSAAKCYVNPNDAGEAVLVRGSLWFGFALFLPLIFVLVGGGGIYFTWRGASRRGGAEAPISGRARRVSGRRIGALVLGAFIVVGLGLLFGLFVPAVLKVLGARSWPETPCTVISSRVQGHDSDDGTTYSVDILYAYEVDGRQYKSNRYQFMGGSSSGHSGKKAIVDAHPSGHQTVCYVDPDDPTDAVLERGFTAVLLFGLIPLVFVAIGTVGLIALARSARRKARRPDTPDWMPAGASPESDHRGRVELKASRSPVGKLVVIIIVALFWNGIVSVFVWQIIKGWTTGDGSYILTLFMVPFVLVGLGLIGAVGYCVLALFNPRATLTASSATLPVGGTVDLTWRISGRTYSIQRLRITLEGAEEATYTRGTRSHTDRETFLTVDVLDTTHPHEMISGQAVLTVPEDTMHSFESAHNKIVWQLHVRGEIRRRPDVDEQYPLAILPAGYLQEGPP